MLRRALFSFVFFVVVDCSLLGAGLRSVDNQALPLTAVTRIKYANTKCACRNECYVDKSCTGVTTFMQASGSFECHFSSTPNKNGSTLVYDRSRLSVSTLLKVVEQTFTTTTTLIPIEPTTTTTTSPTTSPTTTPISTTTTTPITTTTTTPTSCAPAVATSPISPPCPLYFEQIPQLGCFFFSTTNKNYDDAKKECQDKLGALASLGGNGELAALLGYLQTIRTSVHDDYWVDLTRTVDNTEFKWGDGCPLAQPIPWGNSQPTSGQDELCVRTIKENSGFSIADRKCSDSIHFVCRG